MFRAHVPHVLAGLILLSSSAVLAQNSRTAVSRNGSDSNACTTAQPCRSFATAIAKTNPGGEVIALDSGGFGTLAITKPVTVSGAPGVHAAISAATGNAITIGPLATGDHVDLRNLVLIGSGATMGIASVSGASIVTLVNVSATGFTTAGVFNGASQMMVVDRCRVSNGSGISSHGTGVSTVVSDSEVSGAVVGIEAGGQASVVVIRSAISNSGAGVSAIDDGDILLKDSVIVANVAGTRVLSDGVLIPTLRLSGNAIYGNTFGVYRTTAGGLVYTYGNNKINGNTTDLSVGLTMTSATMR